VAGSDLDGRRRGHLGLNVGYAFQFDRGRANLEG
jgi:hypothetical protein